MGAAAVFGGNNSKLNVEQWRCVNTLRGHSGGESLVKGQRSKVLILFTGTISYLLLLAVPG